MDVEGSRRVQALLGEFEGGRFVVWYGKLRRGLEFVVGGHRGIWGLGVGDPGARFMGGKCMKL